MGDQGDDGESTHKMFVGIRWAAVFLLLIIIILSLLDVIPLMDTIGKDIVDLIRDMGAGGGFLWCFVCAAFAMICVPSSLLSLSGGYIWENTVWGTLATLPGVLLGALISFTAGRFLFKSAIERELKYSERFRLLTLLANKEGWKIVFLARLSPIPYGLLNYGFSVSDISMLHYFGATFLGLIPIVIVYAKAGSDFYTYFKTDDLQDELASCRLALSEDKCPGMLATTLEEQQAAARVCLTAAADCNDAEVRRLSEDLECQYNDCNDDEKLSDLVGKDNDDCLQAAIARTLMDNEVQHGDCLQNLNDTELWPKIVFPVCLLLAAGLVMFLVRRYLHNIQLQQLKADLGRQSDMLKEEMQAMKEAELGTASEPKIVIGSA